MADAFTERFLADAGIEPGMRVLDVGCGRGDVSALVARLVGIQGEVVGIDRDAEALTHARERSREPGSASMTFEQADLDDLAEFEAFDAIVGRRVLMYQPDATATLRALARALRPGGLVAFQEHDATVGPVGVPPLPLHESVHGWLWRTVEAEGADRRMGFGLHAAMTEAGLVVGHVWAEAVVQTATQAHHTTSIVRAMLPRILRQGIATEAEIDIDTLDARLSGERERTGATFIGELVFGVWARKPS